MYTPDLYIVESSDDDDNISEDNISEDVIEVPVVEPKVELDVKPIKRPIVQASVVGIQHVTEIEGIKVEMPVRPYECQREVMKALIKGCSNSENSLIESPTGSGKTLALLCGSLAWANDNAKKVMKKMEERMNLQVQAAMNMPSDECCGKKCDGPLENENLEEVEFGAEDWADNAFDDYEPVPTKAPKVFYCSRTHKQLDQVVGELRRTSYGRTTKTTVLSSREFTCIQDTIANKTKLCAELLDPFKQIGCRFYNDHNKTVLGTFSGLKNCGVDGPWDIEEMVELGRENGACPYFAARNLMGEANLILCPYNYVLDRSIRESMQIVPDGNIFILDEAHNIEDFCRECGSLSLSIKQLDAIIENCNGLLNMSKKKKYQNCNFAYADEIQRYCTNLARFIRNTEMKHESLEAFSTKRWTGNEFVSELQKNPSLAPQATAAFMSAARDANAAKSIPKETAWKGPENATPTLDSDNLRIIEKLAWAVQTIGSAQYASDYRMFVKRTFGQHGDFFLEFLCMNPAVVFSPFAKLAKSVILASGTLSPMSSYQRELGVEFKNVIQANHVTPPDQVFIKCVEKNNVGKPIRATYATVNTPEFQDDIGQIILTACSCVPHGILVFVSSYNVMEKLCTRWKQNTMWDKFASMKEIFQETRGSGDMTTLMMNYRDAIRRPSQERLGTITGALLFAVYRGKVAEGIDFSDEEARCVLTIGIPYAVRQHPAVDLKWRYNDQNRGKDLLSGSEWYTTNAFRGLNQALGRAIRHQNDWAAILMVDARIMEPRHSNLLPKWVRSMWDSTKERETDLRALLKRFVASQIRRTVSSEREAPTIKKTRYV